MGPTDDDKGRGKGGEKQQTQEKDGGVLLKQKEQKIKEEKEKQETAEARAERLRIEESSEEDLIMRMSDPRYADVKLPDGSVRREDANEMLMRVYGACWINTGFTVYLTDAQCDESDRVEKQIRVERAALRAKGLLMPGLDHRSNLAYQ